MKISKISLCLILVFSTLLFVVGCSSADDSYPVTVGNTTFDSKPEKVAVLSPNVADIVAQIGYSENVAMVSSEVVTENFKDRKTCGTAIEPDTKKIIDNQIDVVLADDNVSDGALKTLENNDIKVIQFHYGNSGDEILTTYTSVGAILNGENGRKQGEKSYKNLISQLKQYKSAFSKKHSKEKLIYLNGTDPYISVVAESWYSKLLEFTGTDVVSEDGDNSSYDANMIKLLSPDYLVSDKETYNSLKTKDVLKNSVFLDEKHYVEIEKSNLKLQGVTAIENVEKILEVIDKTEYEKVKKSIENTTKPSEKSENVSQNITSTVASSTVPTTTMPKSKYELQSEYNIEFTDDAIKTMVMKADNKYIKAMQERLIDLGYLGKGNSTGYFGELTQSAIKTFQKNNNLEISGNADSETLEKMFSKSAIRV